MSQQHVSESVPASADELAEIHSLLQRMDQCQADWQATVLRRLDDLESAIRGQTDDKQPDNPLGMDWEAKKREVFAAHGVSPADLTDANDDSPASRSAKTPATEASSSGNPSSPQANALTMTPTLDVEQRADLPPADREEIERLKNELREKLRQAEMELSISRAKISRENALLEERRAELERLASRLKDQPTQPSGEPQRLSMLERLNRHMQSLKKNEDLD